MSAARICFGTSTFVAGRLRPEKDSAPGIAALRLALAAGVRMVHSNPKLGTQWAVRLAAAEAGRTGDVKHLVKVEMPPTVSLAECRSTVARAIETSLAELEVTRLYAVVVEPDRKQPAAADISVFYDQATRVAWETGLIDRVIGFCHSPADVAASLRVEGVCAVAALFNLEQAWPADYLPVIAATGRGFLGMAPLSRGTCVDVNGESPARRLHALRWVLDQSLVAATTITMSSPQHVEEVLAVATEIRVAATRKS